MILIEASLHEGFSKHGTIYHHVRVEAVNLVGFQQFTIENRCSQDRDPGMRLDDPHTQPRSLQARATRSMAITQAASRVESFFFLARSLTAI
jgi:hypothetical protein